MGDDTAPTFGVIRELRRKMNDGTEKKYMDYVRVITMISGSTYEFFIGEISAEGSPTEYGKKFLGELKDGLPNGQGTEIYKRVEEEDLYETTFYNEEMMREEPLMPGMQSTGHKKIRGIPLTDKYEGEFKDGDYHGQGTLNKKSSSEGKKEWSKYEGEWKDGKEHGQGTFRSFGGDVYVGGFKEGKKHGQGTETELYGMYSIGEWNGGGLWNGKVYVKKGGELLWKRVNGKVKKGFFKEILEGLRGD
jgi:hypothetical protein